MTSPFPGPRPATADLLSNLEDLELSNRRLAGENAKLQRSVETAEEGSARLAEEILALRKQLRRWALLSVRPCASVSMAGSLYSLQSFSWITLVPLSVLFLCFFFGGGEGNQAL